MRNHYPLIQKIKSYFQLKKELDCEGGTDAILIQEAKY